MNSKLLDKKAMLRHQQRDLPACHPSERAGRLLEIEQLEKEIEELENEAVNDEVLEEATADFVSNIRDLLVTMENEYQRCPHGYTEGYVKAYSRIVEALDEETIKKILKGE
jgi:sRNA-binding protein